MEYKLKVNGRVVAIFENYQNALAVATDVWISTDSWLTINDELPYYSDLRESKTTFKQFSGA